MKIQFCLIGLMVECLSFPHVGAIGSEDVEPESTAAQGWRNVLATEDIEVCAELLLHLDFPQTAARELSALLPRWQEVIAMADSENADVRVHASYVLTWMLLTGQTIPASSEMHSAVNRIRKPALEKLTRLAMDKSLCVRSALARSFGLADREAYEGTLPEDAIALLARFILDEESSVRGLAAHALAGARKLPTNVIEQLLTLLDDEDYLVREEAREAVSRAENLPPQTATALGVVLRHESSHPFLDRERTLEFVEQTLNRLDAIPASIVALVLALHPGLPGVEGQAPEALALRLAEKLTPESAAELIQDLVLSSKMPTLSSCEVAEIAMGRMESVPTIVIERILKIAEHKRYAFTVLSGARRLPDEVLERLSSIKDPSRPGYFSWFPLSALRNKETLTLTTIDHLIQHICNYDADIDSDIDSEEPFDIAFEPDRKERSHIAVEALRTAKNLQPEGMRALLKLTQHDDWYIRHAAVSALGGRVSLPVAVSERLVELLRDEEGLVVREAGETLQTVEDLPPTIVERILQLTREKDECRRNAAVRALTGMVPQLSPQGIDRLFQLTDDEDIDVSHSAVRALWRVRQGRLANIRGVLERLDFSPSLFELPPADSEPLLLQLSRDRDSCVRYNAVVLLSLLEGEYSSKAIERLVGLLGDSHWRVRLLAIYLIAAGRHLADRLPMGAYDQIVRLTYDESPSVRANAATALATLPVFTGEAATRLVEMLGDSDTAYWKGGDRKVAEVVKRALEEVAQLSPETVMQLIELQRGGRPNTTVADRADAILRSGNISATALPRLIRFLRDDDEATRLAAKRAIPGVEKVGKKVASMLQDCPAEDLEICLVHNLLRKDKAVEALELLECFDEMPLSAVHMLVNIAEGKGPGGIGAPDEGEDSEVIGSRESALSVLRNLRVLGKDVIRRVYVLSCDAREGVRYEATRCLVKNGLLRKEFHYLVSPEEISWDFGKKRLGALLRIAENDD